MSNEEKMVISNNLKELAGMIGIISMLYRNSASERVDSEVLPEVVALKNAVYPHVLKALEEANNMNEILKLTKNISLN